MIDLSGTVHVGSTLLPGVEAAIRKERGHSHIHSPKIITGAQDKDFFVASAFFTLIYLNFLRW